MSMMSWLRRRVSAVAPRRPMQHSSKIRPEFLQLEDRLVPSHSVTITVADPPADTVPAGTFYEGVAVEVSSEVTGATGTPTYEWTVLKNGINFATDLDATLNFTPDDNGSYDITLNVTDGAEVASANTLLSVANQIPVAGVSGPTTGAFGQALQFTLTATDSAIDAAEGFTFNIHWNDGTPDTVVAASANNGAGVNVDHTFALPGPNTFTVTATDKDGAVSATVTYAVTVTSGAAVVNGMLTVAGTAGDDAILLIPKGPPRAANATVRVFVNGADLGQFTGVNAATIYALAGNDFVHLAGAIRIPATIYGDAGNDRIKGGASADLLVGGEGDDWLNGHTGRDVLIGGAGADRLLGGPGDDLLIAGAVAATLDLLALQQAWLAPGTYEQHVTALKNPTAAIHLTVDGTAPTVFDDGSADRLTGASGKNWYFATVPQDTVTDRQSFEYLNGAKRARPGRGHGRGR